MHSRAVVGGDGASFNDCDEKFLGGWIKCPQDARVACFSCLVRPRGSCLVQSRALVAERHGSSHSPALEKKAEGSTSCRGGQCRLRLRHFLSVMKN